MTKDSLELMLDKAEIIREMIKGQNYGLAIIDIDALIQNMEYHLESWAEILPPKGEQLNKQEE